MSDTKILQGILRGQAAIREYIGQQISLVRQDIKKVDKKVEDNTLRLDRLGKQLAYLEDDTPTIEEHDNLEKRVGKIEKTIAS